MAKSKDPKIGNAGDPFATDEFVIIGDASGQCSAKDMLAAYKGDARACAVIAEIVDRQRTKKPPPVEFIRTLRNGVTKPIVYVNLGSCAEHSDGYNVLVDGRNRLTGLDIVNADRAAESQPRPPLGIRAMQLPLPRDPAEAVSLVREYMINANNTVAMSPSSMADRAAKLSRDGESTQAIAHRLMIREAIAETEVPFLLALYKCVEEIQDAYDAGDIGRPGIMAVSERPDVEQRTWLAVKMTPAAERKTRGYAPPATFLGAAARHLADAGKKELSDVLTWFAAPNAEAFAALPKSTQAALEKAGLNPATQRIRRAGK